LCDGCNWEFTGFAVPGTVSAKPTRKRKTVEKTEEKAKYNLPDENEKQRAEQRVKVRL
jgi:hypothetical protein